MSPEGIGTPSDAFFLYPALEQYSDYVLLHMHESVLLEHMLLYPVAKRRF